MDTHITNGEAIGPAHLRVLDELDPRQMVNDLVRLIRVPSVTATDAESQLQHDTAARLDELGLDVDVWQIDLEELQHDPGHPGTEVPRSEGYGLVATSPGDGPPALILQGHIDVVPVGDLAKWDHDPFSGHIDGDVVHGRGAADMKAGIAANLAVARALVHSGITLERSFAIHQVISEEDGGLGAYATLKRGHTGEAAVITEPTRGELLVANAGALTFTLTVPGQAAHGSTRNFGVSAIEAFLPLYAAILSLEKERNAHPDPLFADFALPYAISVGRVQAGDWASSVPDLLTAEGRMGVILGEDVADARTAFERTIAEAASRDPWLNDHRPQVQWTGGQFAPGQLEQAHPLIGEVSDAISAVQGRRPSTGAAPYGSDLRLYRTVGDIPTLQYGPGDVRVAHAPREMVSIRQTVEVARSLAVLAVNRLGGHL